MHWKKYQGNLLEKMKQHGQLVVAGDGRHDSMGHCTKYCAYTVFCCTVPYIIHFVLVQVQCISHKCAHCCLLFNTCNDNTTYPN